MTIFKNKVFGYHTPKLSRACEGVLIWLQAIHSQFLGIAYNELSYIENEGEIKKHYKGERWIKIDCKGSNLSLL